MLLPGKEHGKYKIVDVESCLGDSVFQSTPYTGRLIRMVGNLTTPRCWCLRLLVDNDLDESIVHVGF